MQTKDVCHLTLLVLSNQTTLLGYTRVPANDLWDRDSRRTSVRLLFPLSYVDALASTLTLIDEIMGETMHAEMDDDGWAFAPEMTVNLAHILFARTIPDAEVECRMVSGGNYQLRVGGENA